MPLAARPKKKTVLLWMLTWNILDDLPIFYGRRHLESRYAKYQRETVVVARYDTRCLRSRGWTEVKFGKEWWC